MKPKNYLAPVLIALSGPALAGADAGGVLGSAMTIDRLMGYAIVSIVGLVMFFLKKEYNAITGGLSTLQASVHKSNNVLAELKLTVERDLGEARTELALRVEQTAFAASLDRIHRKLNKTAEIVAWMKGKQGLHPDDGPQEDDLG